MQKIGLVSLVVPDYDDAIAFYVGVLGFELIEDTQQTPAKRWVVVAPLGGQGTQLLLAKAANDRQHAAIGNQTGGRVFLFLETDCFAPGSPALRRGWRAVHGNPAERALWPCGGF